MKLHRKLLEMGYFYGSVTMDSEKNESLKSLKYLNVQSLTADLQA